MPHQQLFDIVTFCDIVTYNVLCLPGKSGLYTVVFYNSYLDFLHKEHSNALLLVSPVWSINEVGDATNGSHNQLSHLGFRSLTCNWKPQRMRPLFLTLTHEGKKDKICSLWVGIEWFWSAEAPLSYSCGCSWGCKDVLVTEHLIKWFWKAVFSQY